MDFSLITVRPELVIGAFEEVTRCAASLEFLPDFVIERSRFSSTEENRFHTVQAFLSTVESTCVRSV